MNLFEEKLGSTAREGLQAQGIRTVQVNVGFRCNQQCSHCHLEASPGRTEMMSWDTMELVLEAARNLDRPCFDLTGGAPEMNPNFRRFVAAIRGEGYQVQTRTNLTVFSEPGLDDMPHFFRKHEVKLVASLPCYLKKNVCAQRGEGSFNKSITGLKRLNALGYGSDPGLKLDLVYNPGGPFLPPMQADLEQDYRRELKERFDIHFTHLLTITNMPLGRFLKELSEEGKLDCYYRLLQGAFNKQTVDRLMCRQQISIGWDGTLYDCDFNMAQGLPVNHGAPDHIQHFHAAYLHTRRIVTGKHCFGCTAGAGSSCGGALL